MKIAIDALGIHYVGGGRTATLTLLESLFGLDHSNDYLVFLSQPEPTLESSAGNVRQQIVNIKDRFLLRAWAQLNLPILTRSCDLLHFSKNLGVFGTSPPTVVTMYDMTTLIRPELLPKFDVWYWKTIQKKTLYSAERVIAISHNTADDLVRYYGLPRQKIRVIYSAVDKRFRPVSKDEIRQTTARYGLSEDFFIHVGRLDRKKNIPFLVEAFYNFKNTTNFNGKLVLVGEVYPKSIDSSIQPTISRLGLENEIVFTGRVSDQELPALYGGAWAAITASLHEGFGLAPIEAMACGTPLIAYSGGGATREMAGGAALLFDTLDPAALGALMLSIYQEPSLREKARQKGLDRAAQFSGEETARQTLALYQEIVHS